MKFGFPGSSAVFDPRAALNEHEARQEKIAEFAKAAENLNRPDLAATLTKIGEREAAEWNAETADRVSTRASSRAYDADMDRRYDTAADQRQEATIYADKAVDYRAHAADLDADLQDDPAFEEAMRVIDEGEEIEPGEDLADDLDRGPDRDQQAQPERKPEPKPFQSFEPSEEASRPRNEPFADRLARMQAERNEARAQEGRQQAEPAQRPDAQADRVEERSYPPQVRSGAARAAFDKAQDAGETSFTMSSGQQIDVPARKGGDRFDGPPQRSEAQQAAMNGHCQAQEQKAQAAAMKPQQAQEEQKRGMSL